MPLQTGFLDDPTDAQERIALAKPTEQISASPGTLFKEGEIVVFKVEDTSEINALLKTWGCECLRKGDKITVEYAWEGEPYSIFQGTSVGGRTTAAFPQIWFVKEQEYLNQPPISLEEANTLLLKGEALPEMNRNAAEELRQQRRNILCGVPENTNLIYLPIRHPDLQEVWGTATPLTVGNSYKTTNDSFSSVSPQDYTENIPIMRPSNVDYYYDLGHFIFAEI